MKTRRWFLLGMTAFALVPPGATAQTTRTRPLVWMGPPGAQDGKCFRELFERPDEWKETRARIDGIHYAGQHMDKQFTDDELRQWFGMMRQWGLKLQLEVGAVKEWGVTGEIVFNRQASMWERVERLGGEIHAIAMDEPLVCCRLRIGKSDDYAVQETVSFVTRVRQRFPKLRIGGIEAYPSIPIEDHRWWIAALNEGLAAQGVRGLDFYRLDVNWAVFVVQDKGNWKDVRELERYCRGIQLPFSLIYWAAEYPALRQRGIGDDATWYVGVMQQGYDYAMVQGTPDEYIIQSWVGAPSTAVPETGDFTFTRSVRDFVRVFIDNERIAPQAPPLPPKPTPKVRVTPPPPTPAAVNAN